MMNEESFYSHIRLKLYGSPIKISWENKPKFLSWEYSKIKEAVREVRVMKGDKQMIRCDENGGHWFQVPRKIKPGLKGHVCKMILHFFCTIISLLSKASNASLWVWYRVGGKGKKVKDIKLFERKHKMKENEVEKYEIVKFDNGENVDLFEGKPNRYLYIGVKMESEK